MLEIGGNVGLFTVIGVRVAPGSYTVVEPVPLVAATLRANLARNGLTDVEVLQGAVIPDNNARDVTLNLPAEDWGMPVGAHVIVPGLPIRQLAEGRDLIKIDAEGSRPRCWATVTGAWSF